MLHNCLFGIVILYKNYLICYVYNSNPPGTIITLLLLTMMTSLCLKSSWAWPLVVMAATSSRQNKCLASRELNWMKILALLLSTEMLVWDEMIDIITSKLLRTLGLLVILVMFCFLSIFINWPTSFTVTKGSCCCQVIAWIQEGNHQSSKKFHL